MALSAYSGMPVNVTTGNDDNHDGLALDRPAGVSRNSMHGPGYLDLDVNVSRDFSLTRRKEKASGHCGGSSTSAITNTLRADCIALWQPFH